MTKNVDIINAAVALIIKAAVLAARFSGRARKRSLKRLAAMDVDSKDKEVIFICRSGARSGQVCMFLGQHGYENVINLRGGMIGWVRSGYEPVIPEPVSNSY